MNPSIFQKISLAMALVNGIFMAISDSKLTIDEILALVNTAIIGIAPDLKIEAKDIKIKLLPDGTLSVKLAPNLVHKLSITL